MNNKNRKRLNKEMKSLSYSIKKRGNRNPDDLSYILTLFGILSPNDTKEIEYYENLFINELLDINKHLSYEKAQSAAKSLIADSIENIKNTSIAFNS